METSLVKKNIPKVWSTTSFKAFKLFFFTSCKYLEEPLGRKLSPGLPFFNYLSTSKRKIFLSLILVEIQKRKIVKCFAKVEILCDVSLRLLKIEYFFFLKSIDYQKNGRGNHIPMIDLGKSKKVTAVLKLSTQFSTNYLLEVKKIYVV